MVFIKKSERERRKKASEQCKARNEQTQRRKASIRGDFVPVGRRIVDLALLAQKMWCPPCNVALSFRYLLHERQAGSASVFKIQCSRCFVVYEVPTSAEVPDSSGSGRALFAVNCKFALGKLSINITKCVFFFYFRTWSSSMLLLLRFCANLTCFVTICSLRRHGGWT